MSRFSEADRDRIRSQLVEAGRDLFTQFGFERTRIRDVTEAVDIGTSTFYGFFDSKEALYVEVLCAERDLLEARIDEAVSAATTPRAELRTMLETMFSEVRTNPLISRLIVENELHALQARLSESEQEALAASVRESDLSYADRWVELDEFRFDDPAVVGGVIRSLVFTTRSQETLVEIGGTADYDAVEAALIDTVVAGLFAGDAERDDTDTEQDETAAETPETDADS
ncbi:TetR/AcrR family transcriptional regulator [Halorubrum sp. DTA46]|uniref:TetR/AcrR family transcriptional regulator n=1 Tax=Halorubrum sp. DTA46 TaxID=3402162 RepID=UPI003AB0AEEC